MSVLGTLQILGVVVVLDDLTLNPLLEMSILCLVLVVEQSQFGHCLLQVSVLLLGLADAQLDVSQVLAALVDGAVHLVVLILEPLDLFPQYLLLQHQLLVVVLQLFESLPDPLVVLPQEPHLLLALPNDLP